MYEYVYEYGERSGADALIGTTQYPLGVYGHTNSGANNGGLGVGALDAYFGAGTGELALTFDLYGAVFMLR